MKMSVATIKDPEFINLQPLEINPLMSSCEIKVMYVNQNRNRSYITKEVATEMAKTLRGAPIVGAYSESKGDFTDHGDRITIDSEGVKFECLTKPYGFVSPDAKVWFKEFEDTDEFGNKVVREYLMTTGYLWTGQYEEAKGAIENGKPHSMELDNDTLNGKWATDQKSGMEFFIINDAVFSKLCILGDDVEPCFEGSSVTAPDISKSFTLVDNDFKQSLYTMMQQLKFALGGGQQSMDNVVTKQDVNNTNPENQFSNNSPEEEEKKKKEDESKKEAENKEEQKEKEKKKDDEDKYSLLESKFVELENKFTNLNNEYQNLLSFKKNVEDKKKDELINSFYMLSDDDKKDVIQNKDKYSLDEIESKLSVICVRKKVNFNLDNKQESDNTVENDNPAVTFNLKDAGESLPAWVAAAKHTRDSRNN